MLEQLSSKHDLRRIDPERCKGPCVLDVCEIGVKTELPRLGDTTLVRVDAHTLTGLRAHDLVQPPAVTALCGHFAFADEPEVDHTATANERSNEIHSVHEA